VTRNPRDDSDNGPEPAGIICRVWPTGCAHPELCVDHCFDDDIQRERKYPPDHPEEEPC
jgi:hypothetical protein